MRKSRTIKIGDVFGHLTVLQQMEDKIFPSGIVQDMWLCECDCENHNRTIVSGSHLKTGHTKSCGCLEQLNKKAFGLDSKGFNNFTIKQDYVEIYINDDICLIDIEDLPLVNKYHWAISEGYAISNQIRMHNLSLNHSDKYLVIDPINRNKLDNRKSNLRIVSRKENLLNSFRFDSKNI